MKIISNLESPRLRNSFYQAMLLTQFLATGGCLTTVLYGAGFFLSPDLIDITLAVFGIAIARSAYPYFGFGHDYLLGTLKHKEDFTPLKKWIIPLAEKELTGVEYQEVMDLFAPETIEKLQEIMSATGKLTVYDAVNLELLDLLYGQVSEQKRKDELLKEQIKSQF